MKITPKMLEDAKSLVEEYLEYYEDAGPPGEGWTSDKLCDRVKNIKSVLASIPPREPTPGMLLEAERAFERTAGDIDATRISALRSALIAAHDEFTKNG